jgi:hypothetical protein
MRDIDKFHGINCDIDKFHGIDCDIDREVNTSVIDNSIRDSDIERGYQWIEAAAEIEKSICKTIIYIKYFVNSNYI